MIHRHTLLLFTAICVLQVTAQEPDTTRRSQSDLLDSIYIAEVEAAHGGRPKVLHAEPLYIDLIRDLGAHKGEKEWNMGFGITDNLGYDAYDLLLEYEWAALDRIGFEVETPFTFFGQQRPGSDSTQVRPGNQLDGLKLATQWSFLVNERLATSLAVGYIHKFTTRPFNVSEGTLLTGHHYDPFIVAAKRWGHNFHTLIYAGPQFTYDRTSRSTHTRTGINTNLHYMISGTRNFVGVEVNKEFSRNDIDMTFRPQMRVSIAENLLVGIVTGIPVNRENERFSMFMRLIWEPGHKH